MISTNERQPMSITIRFISIAALLASLGGCASLTEAGHTSYTVTQAPDGKSCELRAGDGKEYKGGRAITFDGGKCQFAVEESGSKAFKGQAIGAKALAVFPVTDLANILKGD